jgi:enediyne polyketide synthase
MVTATANERSHDGNAYVYDVTVSDANGVLVERWQGLRLRAVREDDGARPWSPTLIGPYLERRASRMLKSQLRCVLRKDGAAMSGTASERPQRTELAARSLLGRAATVRHRPDGKPELDSGAAMSASHAGGMTLVVISTESDTIGCDIETVTEYPTTEWARLLGADQFELAQLLARERREPLAVAATRVWSAIECLRKRGQVLAEPITAEPPELDDWVLLRSGTDAVVTFATRLENIADPVVFAILAGEGR